MKVSRIELVEQAVRFRSPERVPIVFWNRDQTEGDVMLYHLALGAPGNGTPIVGIGARTNGVTASNRWAMGPGDIRWSRSTRTSRRPSLSPCRRLFKPRYARQFALAHQLGLHTWFHCCGKFDLIMDDFHEIGADVINISQPNVVDVAKVSCRLHGRHCFMVPISYQTVSIMKPEDIR